MDDFLAYLADTVESHFIKKTDCAGHNCVNSLQRNQPANHKSATGTVVNRKPDLPSCEISRSIYVLIW